MTGVMPPSPPTAAPHLIDGRYAVDLSRPLPDLGGGLPAFAATDHHASQSRLMALRMDRFAPANALAGQIPTAIEGVLTPLAHGQGPPIGQDAACFVIAPTPPGSPLSAQPRPWAESAIIEFVLRPAARALTGLQQSGLTHRAIRPNNVFQAAPNSPVTLGMAWAAPPAMHQPALFETPYTALCHPAGRGPGRLADDVYALGVLLITLSLGRQPMDGLDDHAIIARKLDLGDFAALTQGERLPPMLNDILRGMLAEDPDHRPPPALLSDPVGARGRRVAARPPPRAQRPFTIGSVPAWNSRSLALAMARAPDEAAAAIQNGAVMSWLRRGLGDSGLAVKLEELMRQHALDGPRDAEAPRAILVMRAIAAADPLMPLCWHDLALFPDGLPGLIAASLNGDGPLAHALRAVIATEAAGLWAGMREDRAPASPVRAMARQARAAMMIHGPAGGLARVAYATNPCLPCVSPVLSRSWITRTAALPAALDGVAAAAANRDILDPHVVAFIAARSDRWLDDELRALTGEGDPADQILAALRLLGTLQTRFHRGPLKGLSAWAAGRAGPLTGRWRNRDRRAAIEARLKDLAADGMLPPIVALLADPDGRRADTDGSRAAIADLARLDLTLRALAGGGAERARVAARLGEEIAAGLGLAGAAMMLILAAVG